MTLVEISKEYERSGNLCHMRALELKEVLQRGKLTEKEQIVLNRKLSALTAMARDAFRIAAYLADYYGGSDVDAQ